MTWWPINRYFWHSDQNLLSKAKQTLPKRGLVNATDVDRWNHAGLCRWHDTRATECSDLGAACSTS